MKTRTVLTIATIAVIAAIVSSIWLYYLAAQYSRANQSGLSGLELYTVEETNRSMQIMCERSSRIINTILSFNNTRNRATIRQICANSEGMFYEPDKDQWIAIVYYCRHCYGYDLAIYHDSDGNWLESDYHFCGELRSGAEASDRAREDYSDRLKRGVNQETAKRNMLDYSEWSTPTVIGVSRSLKETTRLLCESKRWKRLGGK